jgi:hypothetical protein
MRRALFPVRLAVAERLAGEVSTSRSVAVFSGSGRGWISCFWILGVLGRHNGGTLLLFGKPSTENLHDFDIPDLALDQSIRVV